MEVLLSSDKIADCIAALADEIVSKTTKTDKIAVIGIRSRGEILAKRLSDLLSKKLKTQIPCGTLDITLYRDDINNPQGSSQPVVRSTEIGFDIDNKIIILVDDVLYTGRSTRAAIPGTMMRKGMNIFGRAPMRGVFRAAVADSADMARCTIRKLVHQ